MKQKSATILAILTCASLLFSACAPKVIGEAKAKEIGLAYINQVFDVNETDATVAKEQVECFTWQDGAIVTDGDASIATRLIYRVRVAKSESITLYEAYVNASTGVPYFARQNEMNIVLTDEQKEKANSLYSAERGWGEKHAAALQEMKIACIQWVEANQMGNYPVLLAVEKEGAERNQISTTFWQGYYVVMRDGTIYDMSIIWPSMKLLHFGILNEQ
ncbi:MAG: hypothetical protein VB091_14095 [Christensenella sp.]|nr:hypothetical protein [Christensenella sp.]